ARALGRLPAPGLRRALERSREDLGLSLPWLALRRARQGHQRAGERRPRAARASGRPAGRLGERAPRPRERRLTRRQSMGMMRPAMQDLPGYALTFFVMLAALLGSGHAVIYKREPRSAALWLLVIWLIPVGGAILYLLIGVNRVERRALRLRRRRRTEFGG